MPVSPRCRSLGPSGSSVAVGELDGRPVVVSGGADSTVRVWDLATGDPLGDPFTGHTGGVRAVAVGELDGRPVVVSGGGDSTLRVWDLATSGNPRVIRLDISLVSVTNRLRTGSPRSARPADPKAAVAV